MTQAAILAASATSGVSQSLKNRIINGAMVIDQRNAGASVTPASGAYLTDRFWYGATQASKFTAQQNAGSVTPPVGFTNYLGMTTASAVSVGASDVFFISQFIEGYNTADLGWGTANAKTVTLSFQVYSSLTGTFGGSLANSAATRAYPFSYSIPVANTWTTISVTITGDTSGTWLTTNGIGVRVYFSLGAGSSVSGTAGSWSGTFAQSATGATSVVGTNGATFYITGVQLEVGTTATNFDYRQFTTELQLCQRYYWKINGGQDTGGSQVYAAVGSGYSMSASSARVIIPMNTQMRTFPTISYGGANYIDDGTGSNITSIAGNYGGRQSVLVQFNTSGSGTTGRGCALYTGGSYPTDFVAGSAEL